MSQKSTVRLAVLLALAASAAPGQAWPWRQIGNTSLVAGQASVAGGPVERVWFDSAGRLFVRLPGGTILVRGEEDSWTPAEGAPPPPLPAAPQLPEAGARLLAAGAVLYAGGSQVWRSEDGGLSWHALTMWRGGSMLGASVTDLAADPSNPERVAVAAGTGVWISHDGGRSWTGLNEGLPALRVRRILAAPAGSRGVRVALEQAGGLEEFEWYPGQRLGWFPSDGGLLAAESAQLRRWSRELGVEVTAVAEAGGTLFAGDAAGRLLATSDGGRTWREFSTPGAGAVLRIWTDGQDRTFALAALAAGEEGAPRLLRTLNGGVWWDDLSPGLPAGDVYGIAADRDSGALYAATASGLFLTFADLRNPAPPTAWQAVGAGLPRGAVRDVRLDDSGVTLLAAVEGYGVYAAPAPHRRRTPRLVHSADLSVRPAAPGALMTLIGGAVSQALAGRAQAAVLAASEQESQIQLPFDLNGSSVALTLEVGRQRVAFGFPLAPAAPAILVDRDGSPMVLDADSGAAVELMNPARPGMTLQVLMSGLGRVRPTWPAGMPAPLENPPAVIAPVRAWLDEIPLEVRRATLAPGYTGFYLVEVELPALLDEGVYQLVVEAGGVRSNPVRIYAVP
ncbi:MAG: hypothetical protein WHT08_06840 [Bryobacteraceae bacterium]